MNNFALRICTAIIGLAVFGFLLFCCYEGFAMLFMVLNLLALKEFYRLLLHRLKTEDGTPVRNIAASTTYFLTGTLLYLLVLLSVFLSPWFLAALGILLIYFVVQHKKATNIATKKSVEISSEQSVEESSQKIADITLAHKFIGFVYITWPFILLSFIAFFNDEGLFKPLNVLGIFLLIWSNDVFAYFVGKRFGKTPLASKISPKKTVEGFMGGFAGSLVMALVLVFVMPELSWHWLALGLIVGIIGPLGDLLESVLKRKADLKDSGRILPGHGGVLDRFDAFLLSAPFVFLYLLWFF